MVDRTVQILLMVLAAMLFVAYWRTVAETASLLAFSEDMAHGLFAPMMASYIFWEKRHNAFGPASKPTLWGLPLLIFAGLLALAGTLGGSTTIARFAFLLSTTGCIALVGGFRAVHVLLFPLALLLFTFPIPAVLYGEITLPLQLFATRLSEAAFELLGFSVLREGNVLELSHQRLSVVEACSGIRSLVTLSFFCLLYAYFLEHRRWLQATIVLAAIPAAILLNVLRITSTGVLGKYAPELTHGTYHDVLGWICLGLGFGLVFLFHRLLSHVFPDVQHA